MLSSFAPPEELLPAGGRRMYWLAALVMVSLAFSLVFACATPFAALAVMAAATATRRDAMACVLAAWLANQLIGYALLDYPLSANSFIWGAVMALAAAACVIASSVTFARIGGAQWRRFAVAFVASFAAYEAVLFLAALTPLGGLEDFTVAIIGYMAGANGLAMSVLLAMWYVATSSGFMPSARKFFA